MTSMNYLQWYINRLTCIFILWILSTLVILNVKFSIINYRMGNGSFNHNASQNTPVDGLSCGTANGLSSGTKDGLSSQTTDTGTTVSVPPNIEQLIYRQIRKNLPNIPRTYFKEYHMKTFLKPGSCGAFPSLYSIEFNNVYWQSLFTSNGTVFLYGAYYDNRMLNKLRPTVRILTMMNRIEPRIENYCQFWIENEREPVISKVVEYKFMWHKQWGNYKQGVYQPYLLTCRIPQGYHSVIPLSVSVVEKRCDEATNNLRVIYNKPSKKGKFGVCVKGLDFVHDDAFVQIVEWIELLTLLGADKIFFYKLDVHENVSKVLKYYQARGRVDVTTITLPGGQPNLSGFQHLYIEKNVIQKRQNELIPLNDCLYRNLYSYEYIVLLDVDEVIMPIGASSWHELMDSVLAKAKLIGNNTFGSYNVRNVYFLKSAQHQVFSDIPHYLKMLQSVHRSLNHSKPGYHVKAFHNPERALILHNHFPRACLQSACTTYPVDISDAQLNHYRADCVSELKTSCEEFKRRTVLDKTIWKFKDALIRRANEVLLNLGYFLMDDV